MQRVDFVASNTNGDLAVRDGLRLDFMKGFDGLVRYEFGPLNRLDGAAKKNPPIM